ncbi:MAG: class I tRNA ligase family protein [Patescibacteria group bacterium]
MAEKETSNKKSDVAFREERILEFWKENKIFEKSLKETEGKKEFIFYEGPPTANGKPGIHHLEARAFKDAIPRYKTMQGFHVRRKGGWDTHGLPVELQVEKKLGLNSKKGIEEYGIAKFNQECKKSVWEYLDVWNKFTKRIGFWLDQENPYVTYHNDYIESVWDIVKKINEQNLLYKDYKVVPWCPRCGTVLSSHELAQGYEDVKDLSVYVKFKIVGQENIYILAWTTTPWTLPGNLALAVGGDIDYEKIKSGNEIYILAKERLSIIEGEYQVLEELKGKDLVGLKYEPLYPYLAETISESEKPKLEKAYKVYEANFVTTVDGTGVVHTAVMYGQDDFVLGTKIGLPKHHLVGLDGKFLPGTEMFEDRFVKDEEVAVNIIKNLAHRGLLLKKEKYEHSYPHCWRCKTPLIYYARDSWYIKMSDPKIKQQLIGENEKINWEPAYIRDGRFGEWLREIKDWAISRERYWGTPLPVWVCDSCKKVDVIGSVEEIKSKTKKSGNKYFIMRHGQAENNIGDIYHLSHTENYHLTNEGKQRVSESIKDFKENIDVIISSPFERTKQTTEVVCKNINFPLEKVIYDARIQEWEISKDFNNQPREVMKKYYDEDYVRSPGRKFTDGESFMEMVRRVGEFIYEIDNKYQNQNIFIVSHSGASRALSFVCNGATFTELVNRKDVTYMMANAEIRPFSFAALPHSEDYELDLHRPYIDEIALACPCGGSLVRAKEVMDVWFDSGAMPFAQDHYPFANKEWVDGAGYPADYIAEAVDQTRGWFYTLHAIGILMGRGRAYKNVICLGHLLDAKGKKMSKSLGNIVDPWEAMDKYGVDTLRLWMYSVNQPGESKNFDEKTVALLHQQVFGLLYNVLAFYELYRDKSLESREKALPLGNPRQGLEEANVLDVWILARLDELIELTTKNLDSYKLLEPTRAIKDFVGDLSTWYLRRSRERIKNGDQEAKVTLYFVLKILAKILAPFAPFAAEDIWLKLKNENDVESVHLCEWPAIFERSVLEEEQSDGKRSILANMELVRKIVSLGLEARQKVKIPVRQPLASLKLLAKSYQLKAEYLDLIKDELNIKEIIFDNSVLGEVELDTDISPGLKAEGEYREFMRELQDQRKKMGLAPGDRMVLSIEMIYKKYKIMPNLQEHMLRVAAIASLICDNFDEPLPKEEIITTCLLHDMGNIIKFNLSNYPEFLEPEGPLYWQSVKDEYVKKYGNDEHVATDKILQELHVSGKIIELTGAISFAGAIKNAQGKNFGNKIVEYCDDRVSPFGIVSLEQRLTDLKERYATHRERSTESREAFENAVRQMEKQIFTKCKIKPEDINDETVKPVISSLRNFVVK